MDEVHFRELLEKVKFSMKQKDSSRWESLYIEHKIIDVSAIRQKYATSPAEFAEMIGVSEVDVYAWENDLSGPQKAIYLLLRIAEQYPEIFLEVLLDY